MRHIQSNKLFHYWDRIRANRPAPKREEIEPSDIRELLGDTFILDVSGSLRTISYRLAGTRLCATFGKELKGQGFLVPWDETDCFEITRMLTKVYRDFTPHLVSSVGKTSSGKFAEFETLFLPIQPIGNGSNRILGISSLHKSPYWIGSEAIENMSVKSVRDIKGEQLGQNFDLKSPSLSPTHFDLLKGNDGDEALPVGQTPTRKVAHLTVHQGGKSENQS